jgi:hypothetical protein
MYKLIKLYRGDTTILIFILVFLRQGSAEVLKVCFVCFETLPRKIELLDSPQTPRLGAFEPCYNSWPPPIFVPAIIFGKVMRKTRRQKFHHAIRHTDRGGHNLQFVWQS